MPIYEYQCESCGHKLEKIQKVTDDRLKDCPSCAEPRLTKLVSAAAFRLKGGGWYETDFKSGSRRNVAESENSGASAGTGNGGGTGSADSKSESKNESKSDSKSDSNSKSVPAAAG